jgi:hypothetical protein
MDWSSINSPTVVVALIAACGAYLSARSNHKIDKLKIEIDGRLGELLEQTHRASAAQGNLDGRAEQTAERKAEDEKSGWSKFLGKKPSE